MTATAVLPIKTSVVYSEDFHRVYTSTYHVLTDSRQDGCITAIEANGIPGYRSPYSWYAETDPWAFCSGISANLKSDTDTAKFWEVTVTHSTRAAVRCGDTRIENPLDEPIKISGSFARFQKPVTHDKDGEPILNSVDEPFVPALEKDDSRDTLILEFNTEQIDLVLRATYRDAISDGPTFGLPAYTLKLSQWHWSIGYLGTCTPFIMHRMEFEINYDEDEEGNVIGWRDNVLQAGFRHKVDCNAADDQDKYRTNVDEWDNQIHQPRALDADGGILNIACGDTPVYKLVKKYKELDFSALLGALGVPDPLPGPFA